MTSLELIKQRIRSTKWGFLAEMIGETTLDSSDYVGPDGVLLINPRQALSLPTDQLVDSVRRAFAEEAGR